LCCLSSAAGDGPRNAAEMIEARKVEECQETGDSGQGSGVREQKGFHVEFMRVHPSR
jgi:hypothetical protein